MIFRCKALHEHIINVDFYIVPNLLFKYFVHQLLAGHPCILQAKRNYHLTKQTTISNKCHLLLIFWHHMDLIESREDIHKWEKLVAHSSIHQLINMNERIAIFQTSLVQIDEINAHSPLSDGLFYQDDIGQPLSVVDFSNKPTTSELVHLLYNSFLSLRSKISLLLFN